MEYTIEGGPAFAYVRVKLSPGESITAESDAMSSMDADLDMKAHLNGGFFPAIAKRFFGGESLFVNDFVNNSDGEREVSLVQATPGDVRAVMLEEGQKLYLQPGAYLGSGGPVHLGVGWAGFKSWIAREGLFRLCVTGPGLVFYGAYGALIEHEVDGEYIVDTSHLVAYEPQMQLKLQMAGGLISSITSGEGLVTRVEGRGKIILQSRSMDGLASWVNSKI